jgi:hypothetical protein
MLNSRSELGTRKDPRRIPPKSITPVQIANLTTLLNGTFTKDSAIFQLSTNNFFPISN